MEAQLSFDSQRNAGPENKAEIFGQSMARLTLSNVPPAHSANPQGVQSSITSPYGHESNSSTPPQHQPDTNFPLEAIASLWASGLPFSNAQDVPHAPQNTGHDVHNSHLTSGPSATTNNSKKEPRHEHRHMWSVEETDALVAGCTKYGVGNWKAILNDPELRPRFSSDRHPGDLKDRFRTKFPDAYHELYPNAKTHVSTSASRKTTETTKSHFEKGKSKERRCFTAAEDAVLKQGYDLHGSSWTVIAKDPVFEGRRKPTDLRDRFRNAFPDLYEQAGYKPRQKGSKSKDRRLSHGSSHQPHSHHDHAVPLPHTDAASLANADLDSVVLPSADAMTSLGRPDSPASPSTTGAPSGSRHGGSSGIASDSELPTFEQAWQHVRTDSGAYPQQLRFPELPRSLSFGSALSEGGQLASEHGSRPAFMAQMSLPAGLTDFAQALRDGLIPEQPISDSDMYPPTLANTYLYTPAPPGRESREGQSHDQSGGANQHNDHLGRRLVAAHRLGEDGPSVLRRTQSSRAARPRLHGRAHNQAVTETQGSRLDALTALPASGNSHSLPPSHVAPANFSPQGTGMAIDQNQLSQIDQILRSHAEVHGRSDQPQQHPPPMHSPPTQLVDALGRPIAPAQNCMELDGTSFQMSAGQHEQQHQQQQQQHHSSSQASNSEAGHDSATGTRSFSVESFQDLLDPLDLPANHSASKDWSGQSTSSGDALITPEASDILALFPEFNAGKAAVSGGAAGNAHEGENSAGHNAVAGDLLHRGRQQGGEDSAVHRESANGRVGVTQSSLAAAMQTNHQSDALRRQDSQSGDQAQAPREAARHLHHEHDVVPSSRAKSSSVSGSTAVQPSFWATHPNEHLAHLELHSPRRSASCSKTRSRTNVASTISSGRAGKKVVTGRKQQDGHFGGAADALRSEAGPSIGRRADSIETSQQQIDADGASAAHRYQPDQSVPSSGTGTPSELRASRAHIALLPRNSDTPLSMESDGPLTSSSSSSCAGSDDVHTDEQSLTLSSLPTFRQAPSAHAGSSNASSSQANHSYQGLDLSDLDISAMLQNQLMGSSGSEAGSREGAGSAFSNDAADAPSGSISTEAGLADIMGLTYPLADGNVGNTSPKSWALNLDLQNDWAFNADTAATSLSPTGSQGGIALPSHSNPGTGPRDRREYLDHGER